MSPAMSRGLGIDVGTRARIDRIELPKDCFSMLKSIAAGLFAMLLPALAQAEMTFEHFCEGNSFESCYTEARGQITTDTLARFEAHFADNPDGNQLYLSSPGGSLGAAVKMGQRIRNLGLETSVLDSCESACAYMFLGGSRRSLAPDTSLGFHRFNAPDGDIGSDKAQMFAAQIIVYLVSMGIDPRFFLIASGQGSTGMHYVTQEEAVVYELVSPYGYRPFTLDPYGRGVVAAAKRIEPTSPYDLVTQVTAFCRDDGPHLMFHAPEHGLTGSETAAFVMYAEDGDWRVPATEMTARVSPEGAYMDARLSREMREVLTNASSIQVLFEYPRAFGGYGAALRLSSEDHRMLAAAFNLCI
jgi:hypothetical protein